MGANCYFIYRGEPKNYYYVEFRLFDDNYISFVSYDNKYLLNEDSHGKSEYFSILNSSNYYCDKIKDPFQERISCIDKIDNCMYCKNESICEKCNYGFSLLNKQCFPTNNFIKNLEYFTPDNGTNFYPCSSIISDCKECTYDDFSFNKFHCTKFSTEVPSTETLRDFKFTTEVLDDTNKVTDIPSDNITVSDTSGFSKFLKENLEAYLFLFICFYF